MSSVFFFFSSRRRHTRFKCDWSSDVCSSDLTGNSVRAGTVGAGLSLGLKYFAEQVWDLYQYLPYKPFRAISVPMPALYRHYDRAGLDVQYNAQIGRASCRERV